MLGDLLAALARPDHAAALLEQLAEPALLQRVKARAAQDGVSEGDCIAGTVRHMIEHADEALWLDMIGRMARSPQPGAAALQLILSRGFPDATPAQSRLERP